MGATALKRTNPEQLGELDETYIKRPHVSSRAVGPLRTSLHKSLLRTSSVAVSAKESGVIQIFWMLEFLALRAELK